MFTAFDPPPKIKYDENETQNPNWDYNSDFDLLASRYTCGSMDLGSGGRKGCKRE